MTGSFRNSCDVLEGNHYFYSPPFPPLCRDLTPQSSSPMFDLICVDALFEIVNQWQISKPIYAWLTVTAAKAILEMFCMFRPRDRSSRHSFCRRHWRSSSTDQTPSWGDAGQVKLAQSGEKFNLSLRALEAIKNSEKSIVPLLSSSKTVERTINLISKNVKPLKRAVALSSSDPSFSQWEMNSSLG